MSGDVQPRKRKDKKRKKDEIGVEEPRGTAAVLGEGDVFIHSQHDHGTGGHWCAKIIFFSLLAILIGLISLIILENRGLSELEANAVESRYSGVLEGWLEDAPDDNHHDEHTLDLIHHDDNDDDEIDQNENNFSNELDQDTDNAEYDNEINGLNNEDSKELYNDDNGSDQEHKQGEDDDHDYASEEDNKISSDNEFVYKEKDWMDQTNSVEESEETLMKKEDDNEEEQDKYINSKYFDSEEGDDDEEENVEYQQNNNNGKQNIEQLNEFMNHEEENLNVNFDANLEYNKADRMEDYNEHNIGLITRNIESDETPSAEEDDPDVELEKIEKEVSDEVSTKLPDAVNTEESKNQDNSNENISEEDDEDFLSPEDIEEVPIVEHITATREKPLIELDDETSSEKPPNTLAEEEEYEIRQAELRREKEQTSHVWLKVVVGGALLVATHAVIRRATAPREDGGNSVEDEWPGEPSEAYWRQQLDQAEQDLRKDWLD